MPQKDNREKALQGAFSVAEKFLATMTRGVPESDQCRLPPVDVAQRNAETWYWDDQTPLFEIPLMRGEAFAGSIIVSTVKTLPPVAIYRTYGPTFAKEVTDYLANADVLNTFEPTTLYLITPLEPVVKVKHRKTGAISFFALPDLKEYSIPPEHRDLPSIIRNPLPSWMARVVDAGWALLEKTDNPRTTVIKDVMRPVKYQQACDSYRMDVVGESGNNYCTPRGIAGCVPVAWAMMASSMKKAYEPRIWSGVTGWDIDWPSCGGNCNPSQCNAVNQTIWGVHGQVGTTPDGGTSSDHEGEGGNYLTAAFHLPTEAYGGPGWVVQSPDMNRIRTLINIRLRPVFYSGTGQWPHLFERLARELGFPDATPRTRGGGVDGHAVVAYGCDLDGYLLYICFGWGSGVGDAWIDLGWYQDAQIIFNQLWNPDH